MKTHLEYRDDKSAKFWEIEIKGGSHTVRFGKIGTKGQSKTKDFDTPAEARASADKLIAQKRKKGYGPQAGGAVPVGTVKGAVFYKSGDQVTPNSVLAEMRGDGKNSKADAQKLSGFGSDGLVGVALYPPADGYLAVVDSADGCQGIQAGPWSRVAMIANHLLTDAIWYRAFSDDLALAVHFHRGGGFFEVVPGDRRRVTAWLEDQGVSLVKALPPAMASDDATLVTIRYPEDKYQTGPDAGLAASLVKIQKALEDGDAKALSDRCDEVPLDLLPLALGVVRGAEGGKWQACLQDLTADLLVSPMQPRKKVKEMTLEEEVMRRVATLGDFDLFCACLERLDAIEADAEASSSWAQPAGVARLAHHYHQDDPARALACYLRLLRRTDEPHWLHVNTALIMLLTARPGKISLKGEDSEVVKRAQARLPKLGADAQDAVYYNLACVFARAGQSDRAMEHLQKCNKPRQQNAHPEKDADLKELWKRDDFKTYLDGGGKSPESTPLDELETSVRTSDALGKLGVNTIGELLHADVSSLPAKVIKELQLLLREDYDIQFNPAGTGDPEEEEEDEDDYVPPPDRAVPRQTITWHDSEAASELVSRLGGVPNVPSNDTPWPEGDSRPMQLILQLVGKAAGGEVDLGDVQVLQLFADMDGDYYEDNQVVLHRSVCDSLLEPPTGIEPLPVKTMELKPGQDDNLLLQDYPDDDDEIDAHEAAHDHAWEDKLWGIPVGANLDPDQLDSQGKPMKCLVQLISYDDWFLWYLFVNDDFSEARAEIVRG